MKKRIFKLLLLLLVIIGTGMTYWKIRMVEAGSKTITSRLDFEKGIFDGSEANFKEGELKIKPAGSWGASSWRTPDQGLNSGTALVSDENFTYVLAEWNLYFARYRHTDNTWQQLAKPPYNPGGGGDMVILGDYIYTIFGSRSKQRYFARYSISQNTWEVLPETFDKMDNGASLVTDGRYIYCARAAWTSDFWRYDPEINEWTTLNNSILSIVYGAGMVYKDGNIYTPRGYYQDMLRYNIALDIWTTLAQSPQPFRAGHNVDLVGDYIYVTRDSSTKEFYRYKLPDLTIVGGARIDNGGGNYVAGDLVVDNTGTGGSGFAGTYTVNSSGRITGITVTSIGYSYASLPKVYPRSAIRSVGISAAGSGYTAGELVVDNTGTGGSGFAGTYTVNGSGAITGITITNNGDGYNSMPVITPQVGGTGAVLIPSGGSGAVLTALDNHGGSWERLTDTPQTIGNVGVIYSKAEDLIYVFRGNGYYDFWKYDYKNNIFVEPVESYDTFGTGSDLIYNNGYLYAPRGQNTSPFYRYSISSNTWVAMPALPYRETDPSPQVTFNSYVRGVGVSSHVYFMRGNSGASGTSQQTFIRFNTATNAWEYLADTPLYVSEGGALVNVNVGGTEYIYATAGGYRLNFWRYRIDTNTWETMPNVRDSIRPVNGTAMISNGTDIYMMAGYGQTVLGKFNIGTTTWSEVSILPFAPYAGSDMTYYDGKIFAQAGSYKKDIWEYTIASNTWRRLPDLQGYGPLNHGPYNGGSLEVDNLGNLWSIYGAGTRYLQKYTPSSSNYLASGRWLSEEMDLGYVETYGEFVSNYTLPGDSAIIFESRTSDDKTEWTDWEEVVDGVISSDVYRYIQFRVTMTASSGNALTPTLYDISFSYTGDTEAPSNPTVFEGKSQQVLGLGITSEESYRYPSPYFTWSGADDNNKSGVEGYYVYFGLGETADPEIEGTYQTMSSYMVLENMINGETYYLRIKTKDEAGNISEASTGFVYIYAGVDPASVEIGTSELYGLGETLNVDFGGDKLRLKQTSEGVWLQETFRGTPVPYYGSNLVYVESRNKLYLLPGRDTREFWEYDIPTNTWLHKGTTPDIVYHWGASLVEGPEGFLYGLQGKYTRSFWQYDIENNIWSDEAAADIPLSVGHGTDLVYDGSRYIYAMRGNSSSAFYRYDPMYDLWERLTDTDFGSTEYQSNNLVSSVNGPIAYDGDDSIFAIKGGGTNGFAVYSINNDFWSVLPALPDHPNSWARIVYEASTHSIYYQSGYSFFYRYDINSQTWHELPDVPYTPSAGTALVTVGTKLYWMRGGWTNTTGIFDVKTQTWNTPPRGLFNEFWKGNELRGQTWGSAMVKGEGQNYYITNGNFSDAFAKYNPVTDERTRLADIPQGNYHMGKMVYLPDKNKIMMTSNYYYRGGNWFTYDIPTDTWTVNTGDTMPWTASTYYGHSMIYDDSRYIYATRGQGSSEIWKYDTEGVDGSRWSRTSNTLGGMNWGPYLAKEGNYLYILYAQGATNSPFYRMDLGTTLWTTLPAMPGRAYQGAWLVSGEDGYLYASRGENRNEMYKYHIGTSTWTDITNLKSPNFGSAGGDVAFNGTDRLYVIPGSASDGTWNTGIYTYILKTENTAFEREGTYISPVHDLGKVYRLANLTVGYTSADNFSFTVYTKTSADEEEWTDWEIGTLDKDIEGKKVYKINSPKNRYMQVKIELFSADGVYSGVIDKYTINYFQDAAPPSNPEQLDVYNSSVGGTSLASDTWYNYEAPKFDWPDAEDTGGASDGVSGSGVKGYYVYFGVGETADPAVDGQFISASEYVASGLVSGNTYYFKVKAVDDADNINETAWEPFVYHFDNIRPENPSTLVADPPGYTTANSYTFTWNEGTDEASEVYQYCYKTGDTSVAEVCTADTVVAGIPSYKAGTNTFYLRTKDTAGNYSSGYITAAYYYSANAPAPPANLVATPIPEGSEVASNPINEFAFTWSPPPFYFGTQAGLRYYYSINALPTAHNVNTVGLAQTYLPAGEYATQRGTNTFYVVAKDEAGNIDYSLYASVEFIADTTSPGIPLNMDIADVSIKETKNWKLATTWDPPESSGSGIAYYKVYRSRTEGANCATNIDDFRPIAQTWGESHVESNLTQVKHYYCVRACDSTNECSAPSDTVVLLPDGKWRVAPTLVSEPEAVVRTKSATISWSTNRTCNSFVKYGKSSGNYGEEVGSSEHVSSHEILLVGLDPGTTYYYKTTWTDEDGNTGESEEYTLETNPAPVVSKVAASDVGMYSAYINFTLANATKATVQYGKTASYGSFQTITTAMDESIYNVKLSELSEGTVYHFRILAEDEEENQFFSDDYIFETLPVPRISDVKIQQVKGMSTSTIRLAWKSNTGISSIVTTYPDGRPEMAKDQIVLTLTKNHEMIVKDLLDDTDYVVIVKGKDIAGNSAENSINKFKTSEDLRPPLISDLKIDTTVSGIGEEAKAQILVSWNTDEPATTQVEYGQGTGSDYPNKTQKNDKLTLNHVVTIPDLNPDQVYHLRVLSEDKSANLSVSYDNVVLTTKATRSALDLVVESLSKSFGFVKNISGVIQ